MYSVRHTKAEEEMTDDEHDGFTLEMDQEDYEKCINVAIKPTTEVPLEDQLANAIGHLIEYARIPDDELDEEKIGTSYVAAAIILYCVQNGGSPEPINSDELIIVDQLDVGGGMQVFSTDLNAGHFDIPPEDFE